MRCDQAAHAVRVVPRQVAAEQQVALRRERHGRDYGLAGRDRDLAGTRRVVGLGACPMRPLHLRVAHDELVIDRVGVLDNEA